MFGMTNTKDPASEMMLTRAKMERDARKTRIGDAWKRYEGDHPLPLLATGTDPGAEDNTIVNLARKTVDIAAFYLFGMDISFEMEGEADKPKPEDGAPKEVDPAEEYLQAVWKDNRQATFLLEFATSAGVSGDGFIRVYPPTMPGEFPRLVSLDAQTVDVTTDPQDMSLVIRYTIEFNVVDVDLGTVEAHRHIIAANPPGQGWQITEQVSTGNAKVWITVADEHWPYEFAPIFHCKNRPSPHCYYGMSDIEADVLALNTAISFVISNINRILRVHGHPQLWIAGQRMPPEGVDRAIDKVLEMTNPDSKVGAVPYVTELTAHSEQLRALRDAYHELTSVPEVATGKLENIGQLSGLALQILYGPLVQLIKVKRLFFGEMLIELCEAILILGGFADTESIVIRWPQIIPTDRGAEADTAIILQSAGVSQDTTLTELGYDPEEEAAKRSDEQIADAKLAMEKLKIMPAPPTVQPIPGDNADDPAGGGAA